MADLMTKDIRICFVGDSFVNGTGDETALGWAGRLCVRACASGTPVTYYNLGIRRNTSREILWRWESECAIRLPRESDGRIVFSFGVNDTAFENGSVRVHPKESCRNLRDILNRATQLQYKVLMVGPPPIADKEHNERVKAISQAFAAEAAHAGVSYIELFRYLADDEMYKQEVRSNDEAHPKSKGYAKIAYIISLSPNWWFNKS